MSNPLTRLEALGQSLWLDSLSRELIDSGELARLIREDGVRGITSNPAIFEKAINGSAVYDDSIRRLARAGRDTPFILRQMMLRDIRDAAELLRQVWEDSEGNDGYVSLEVSPQLAYDTEGTLREARELWSELERPNVMIKVPGTAAGLPAIRQLISEGINVNVTLLFSVPRYREVWAAWQEGIEEALRLQRGTGTASVASFFLSRIDSLIDPLLEKAGTEQARGLRGQAAIASARMAYRHYRDSVAGERFGRLAASGARAQRLLWASTSTKNPAYPDTKYVEALIGVNTVNTLPMETLVAYRDHGDPAERLAEGLHQAEGVLAALADCGIDLEAVCQELEADGVRKFLDPWNQLLASLEAKRKEMLQS